MSCGGDGIGTWWRVNEGGRGRGVETGGGDREMVEVGGVVELVIGRGVG